MSGRPPSADIVVGLGWGDESKGATVDALAAAGDGARPGARPTARVVRFNGGHQAGHNVVAGGRHHTFSSFGSATFLGVPTWLSWDCLVEPSAALREATALRALGLTPSLHVHEGCLVTTPLHVAANLAREAARGSARHGTTGRGIGETVAYSLRVPDAAPTVSDLADSRIFLAKAATLAAVYASDGLLPDEDIDPWRDALLAQLEAARCFEVVGLDRFLNELSDGHTIFEGAQGFWLDESFGFQPHTTWSKTTPANARALARLTGIDQVRTIGCVRTYATRHGAGPLPHEDELALRPPEPHNGDDGAAGRFRVAPHDAALLRAAIDQTMCDGLAISHLDVFDSFQTSDGSCGLTEFGPVVMTASGPGREDRRLLPTL